jgi:hypothetical protein
MLIAP